MKREGFAPAATVEASPGSFQAWVRLSEGALSAEVRRVAAEGLARHYEGEARNAGSGPYGRLAGFTNQAPEHAREGRQPYVLAHDCPGQGGHEGACASGAHRAGAGPGGSAGRAPEAAGRHPDGRARAGDAGPGERVPRRQAQRYLGQHGFKTDFARMDEAIAGEIAKASTPDPAPPTTGKHRRKSSRKPWPTLISLCPRSIDSVLHFRLETAPLYAGCALRPSSIESGTANFFIPRRSRFINYSNRGNAHDTETPRSGDSIGTRFCQ